MDVPVGQAIALLWPVFIAHHAYDNDVYCHNSPAPVHKEETLHRIYVISFIAASLTAALNAQDNPFSADARQTYALIKDSLLRAADKMPEEYYSFRTVLQVRTFGEMI